MTIKVMIVDDSSLVRQVIQDLLEPCHDINVIATAQDPIFAMAKMRANWPDVIVLDIEMPRMDGITFLRQIMAIRPTPVVICSSLAERSATVTMEALAAGAVGIITKPQLGIRDFLQDSSEDLIAAIRAAAQARLRRTPSVPTAAGGLSFGNESERNARHDAVAAGIADGSRLTADVMLDPPGYLDALIPVTQRIIAIGASTGGPQALEKVLRDLSEECPGVVIVQHMPEKFTLSFAKRLNAISVIEVKEAEHHDLVLPGRALVAPGGSHMMVKRDGVQYYVEVVNGPLVSRHKPSVDVLFRSVAKAAGKNAVGVIMTGMGDDGARGMKELRDAGASTYAQDESSCVVFGMPKEAMLQGGVCDVISLESMSSVINQYGY
ncbi:MULTISPECIES: chemotaxis response regulator protein-glutamate methylesterase [unclassified Herbaspirillum]|uniref:protein-glutamate methylesterase/protein-glutamine glutaminase n=1 Tax=unclassified Herbaspirillum TaxID=2624150 RepID=UPI000E2F1938|nr:MULTISPECIES: chemotaxis response regulator protein-glutamate methylesterase [unclassified Herbaspirillum]RFB70713.1 chemotaxis response regulator protein-glutamate methylesterase [Herbaspirillum sp. 3R-3a1]TFI08767.1 chemotaxis response regulator protein-glutamate methylesterase [Herbaspirillum sp. 3R11]TFI15181.1 chemotaxis response regulator protein-glutamate methylesterase [Herbaspirillum sp. 3R-11]TFI24938.1 chemotaxis response regulator protein-glutamate methylesterase [Herbaspirillum 